MIAVILCLIVGYIAFYVLKSGNISISHRQPTVSLLISLCAIILSLVLQSAPILFFGIGYGVGFMVLVWKHRNFDKYRDYVAEQENINE